MQINIFNDLSIKRKWRFFFRLSLIFILINFFKNSYDNTSYLINVPWCVFQVLYTLILLRIKWLYDHKKAKLQ